MMKRLDSRFCFFLQQIALRPSLKKWGHFDLKSWVTGGTKIHPGIPSNWRIFESNWLDIESQMYSILRVTSTQYWESIRLDIESQFDSILRVNLTRYWESIWLDIESQFDSNFLQLLNPGSNFCFTSDSNFWVKMTPFFLSALGVLLRCLTGSGGVGSCDKGRRRQVVYLYGGNKGNCCRLCIIIASFRGCCYGCHYW